MIDWTNNRLNERMIEQMLDRTNIETIERTKEHMNERMIEQTLDQTNEW